MIIDFHTHCYPDKVAPKALHNLYYNNGVAAHSDGTLNGLRESMATAGINLSVVLPIATNAGQFPKLIDWAGKITQENEDIIAFGSVFPREDNWQEQIDYIKKSGLPGLKLHPDFQEFYFKEQRILDMISYAIDIGLLVTVHVGVDPSCLELVHSTPQMVRRLVADVQSERLILAHLGGHLYWDEVLEYICGTNCTIDMALTTGTINSKKLLKILAKHGYDRILFGTDSPWSDQSVSVRMMEVLDIQLPEGAKDKIMYGNAARLLNL
jgi:predicted TIM-barrel fold metal-dependent hydrolase